MPPPLHIVTDSAALFFDPASLARYPITVLPLRLQLGHHHYQEGVDLPAEVFLQHCANPQNPPPRVSPPPAAEFTALYQDLCREGGAVLSLHSSNKLHQVPRAARAGANAVLGRYAIEVVDSHTTSLGLGLLVLAAAEAAAQGMKLPDLVRFVRNMQPRLYSIFYVESMDYLAQTGRLSKAQAVLGTMLGVKPFLTLDEGNLVPMEKVRNRTQAIEKIAEFVVEFGEIEALGILHSHPHPNDDTRQLLERLALDFPHHEWPVLPAGPALGALLGPRAMGVMVLESEDALGEPLDSHADLDD